MKIQNYIIFALIVLCGFLYTCGGTKIEKEIETHEVTTYKYKHDTIKIHDTTVREISLYKTIYKTVPKVVPDIDDTSKKYYKYTIPFDDSIIKGKIETTILKEKLYDQKLEYEFKVPRTIIIKDSIFKTTTITKTIIEKKNKIFLGSTLYQVDAQNIGISLDALFKTKRNLMFGGGYDPFRKTANIKFYIGLGK